MDVNPVKLVVSITIELELPSMVKYRMSMALLSIITSEKLPNHVEAYAKIRYFFLCALLSVLAKLVKSSISSFRRCNMRMRYNVKFAKSK